MVAYADINKMLQPFGFCLRGGFVEQETYLLVGNVGSDIWKFFGAEHDDWVEPDPLDSWTRKHLGSLAETLEAEVIYPFEGPKYAPFQMWAMSCDCVYQSPIGPLIHPTYGLWHAYRGALVMKSVVDGLPERVDVPNPCKSCTLKPCLTACPVNAFTGKAYEVPKCMDYLNKNLEGDCMHNGCLARRACPVGRDYAYKPAHNAFHMARFRTSAPKT